MLFPQIYSTAYGVVTDQRGGFAGRRCDAVAMRAAPSPGAQRYVHPPNHPGAVLTLGFPASPAAVLVDFAAVVGLSIKNATHPIKNATHRFTPTVVSPFAASALSLE